jgi:hypothetical protein
MSEPEGETTNEANSGTWKSKRGKTGRGRDRGASDVRLHKETHATVRIQLSS